MGWLIVFSFVALALLIAYLVDRGAGIGRGMTDRDRHEADRAIRRQEDRVRPWGDIGGGG